MGSTCENCNFSRGTQWAANLKLPTAGEGVEKRQREVRNKNCNSSSLVLRRHAAAAAVGLSLSLWGASAEQLLQFPVRIYRAPLQRFARATDLPLI